MEHVRGPLLGERRSLLDAEAVLLVDDGDSEVAEDHVALDQGVRPDGDLDVARGEQGADVGALARGQAGGEEGDAHAQLRRTALRS